jgi:murein DD-endopeptidase MepM/ murein hydrolase activator NlpD
METHMSGKATAGIVGILLVLVVCCAGALGLGAGGAALVACTDPASALPNTSPGSPPSVPSGGWAAVGRWDSHQVANAAIIVAVGQQRRVPPRGWVIAVAVAMQESSLTNLGNLGPRNDHDSLGLFQQRPSQGWGTAVQVVDPVYASTQFYSHLLRVPNWQNLPFTDAAQAVQRSAFPDAYARWEPDAIAVVATVSGLAQPALVACGATGPWIRPVHGPVTSGFRTRDRPSHDGVDIAAPIGSMVAAASAGIVTVVACQAVAPDGSDYGCDRDGSEAVKGCGWYVDIQHGAGIITRSCHLHTQPRVTVGQTVAAGEPVGQVGTSGNSSGPHLHFEVHINNDSGAAGVIDPEGFMRDRGVSLGE